jgi:hypothetical protein
VNDVLDKPRHLNSEDETQSKPREYRVKVSLRSIHKSYMSFIIGEAYSKKLASVFGVSDYVMRDIIRKVIYGGRSFSFGPYTKDIAETLAAKAQDI